MKTLKQVYITLPTIEKEISLFLASIYETNPEIKDDDDFKLDILEGSTDFIEIVDGLFLELLISNSYISGIKSARDKLSMRETKYKTRVKLIRGLIQRLMAAANVRSVKAPTGSASITPTAPSVEIVDEGLLPDDLMRITIEPNKTLIGEKLKAGEIVLGARLSNGGETLTIR